MDDKNKPGVIPAGSKGAPGPAASAANTEVNPTAKDLKTQAPAKPPKEPKVKKEPANPVNRKVVVEIGAEKTSVSLLSVRAGSDKSRSYYAKEYPNAAQADIAGYAKILAEKYKAPVETKKAPAPVAPAK